MKKRWISVFVENEIGVLATIAGLFSGKLYNLNSLNVGTTEDASISRMTISLISDDKTFEQVKKQLQRCVDVIKVLDYTEISMHQKEVMYVRIRSCTKQDIQTLVQLASVYALDIIEYQQSSMLMESVHSQQQNDALIVLLKEDFQNRIEIIRGGCVAIEVMDRSLRNNKKQEH